MTANALIYKELRPRGASAGSASPGGACNSLTPKVLCYAMTDQIPRRELLSPRFLPHPAEWPLEPLTAKASQS
jgi:hypothetical protein